MINDSGLAFRAVVAQALSEGMETTTHKVSYDGVNLYVKLGFLGDRLAYVSAQTGNHGIGHAAGSLEEVEATVTAFSTLRGFLEASCVMANALLEHGIWEARDLVQSWRGTRFAPDGVCPQLEGFVKSPLDAIALVVEKRLRPEAGHGAAVY